MMELSSPCAVGTDVVLTFLEHVKAPKLIYIYIYKQHCWLKTRANFKLLTPVACS
jgi:hypothetical protein